MKYKYRVAFGRITKVEIIKETEKQVVIDGLSGQRREAKESNRYSYHDTFEAAKDWAVNIARQDVDKLKRKIKSRENALKIAMDLKED